jgi:hypothetical protein
MSEEEYKVDYDGVGRMLEMKETKAPGETDHKIRTIMKFIREERGTPNFGIFNHVWYLPSILPSPLGNFF